MSKTRATPNYALLREAYAIIGGIPDEAFDLEAVVVAQGESLACGTICCAAGWLALHPKMQEAGDIELKGHWLGTRSTGRFLTFDEAMAKLFDIPKRDAVKLFAPRLTREYGFAGTDKELWLRRVHKYLARRRQLTRHVQARGETA